MTFRGTGRAAEGLSPRSGAGVIWRPDYTIDAEIETQTDADAAKECGYWVAELRSNGDVG